MDEGGTTELTRLYVVNRARLYAEALAHYLEQFRTVEVVGAATSLPEACEGMAASLPDVVLVDTTVGPGGPLPLMRLLLSAAPGLKVIAMALPDAPDEVVAWGEAGASGYVTSETPLHDLVQVIESTVRGELLCSAGIANALLRRVQRLAATRAGSTEVYKLTPREYQVVDLIAQGLSNKEISRTMGISLPTVKNHVHNIFEKLQVHRRGDALARLGRRYEPLVLRAPVGHGSSG